MYVSGFVRPSTGQVIWFLADTVNTALFSAILAAFAREVGAGPGKRVIIVLDGAGWHVSDSLEMPAGIDLEFLLAYSPELQPAERLRPLTNEPLANQHFDTLADLDDVLADHAAPWPTIRIASGPRRCSTGGQPLPETSLWEAFKRRWYETSRRPSLQSSTPSMRKTGSPSASCEGETNHAMPQTGIPFSDSIQSGNA